MARHAGVLRRQRQQTYSASTAQHADVYARAGTYVACAAMKKKRPASSSSSPRRQRR